DDELAECSKYLKKQIEIIKPEVIVTLGSPATKYILNTKDGITSLRGKWGEYMGIPVMPTFHPSYVIRNGGEKSPLKKDVWNDIKLVMERVGIPIEAKE
ncbi:MAG TPA: uracil-DNA glycosylase, partial [Spirochaetota bacterium]|nr:uracil-DNA glycosylase [Spirochaetota bacterium]